MDTSHVFDVLLGFVNLLAGFVLHSLWQAVKDLQRADSNLADKVNSIEVLVAGQYVKREYFESKMEALFAKLEHMENKFDDKLDKAIN